MTDFGPVSNTRGDAMILVMGASGTGKSEFIRTLTGEDSVYAGYGPESDPCQIALSQFRDKQSPCVTFVDTPGFDNSRKGVTDADILKMIAAFLDSGFKTGKKLYGVIYMYRISDPGVDEITTRNLRMLQKLCGFESLKNVVIVTTMWDSVNDVVGDRREVNLQTEDSPFKPLLDAGAQFMRQDDDFASAYGIMTDLLGNQPVQLLIQTELNQGKNIADTTAGSDLNAEIQKLVANLQKEMEKVREGLMEAIKAKDQNMKRVLEQERKKLAAELQGCKADKLKLGGSLDSIKARPEAQREGVNERAMVLSKRDLTVARKKEPEMMCAALSEESALREIFLANGEQWNMTNVSDGVYKIAGPNSRFSSDKEFPIFWLIDSRKDDFELKAQSTGEVFDLYANDYDKKARTQKPNQSPPLSQSSHIGSTPQPLRNPAYGSNKVEPGTYNIRNRVTLNQLGVYENATLVEAKLQVWGPAHLGATSTAFKFTVSTEKDGTVAITSTHSNMTTPRYLIDNGGAMMNTTKSNRVRLIPAGLDFYYIVVNIKENMAIKDQNASNVHNGYSFLEELDTSERRQMWEFLIAP